jgi:nitrite reductase (NO-forming)
MASTITREPRAPSRGARVPEPRTDGNGGGPGGGRRRGEDAFYRGLVVFLGLALIAVTGLLANPATRTASTAAPPAYKLSGPGTGTVVDVDLHATETVQEIADGVDYHVWTFNGTAPGPVIRVQVGDTIHFTLHNDSTIGIQHSIDFHAAMTPWANPPKAGSHTLTGNYQPVSPGETKTFDWVARYPGVFMYHCGVPPVLQHISNGMYGAIIVEPENLPAEREFVLVSSEFYPGAQPIHGLHEGDLDAMAAAEPSYVVFDGMANRYQASPLQVQPDERFRIWVMNAGPTLTNAFHVIGAMFEETHDTGNPANTDYGLQTFSVPPGSGAMFELQIEEEGLYPFVTHSFAYTGLGAVGLVQVTKDAPAVPATYPTLGDPFNAGVTAAKPYTPPKGPAPQPTTESGGSGGGGAPSAQLAVTAKGSVFSTDTLTAPAGKAFTIEFDNQDPAIPHNVAIYTDESATEPLFVGDLVTGPDTITYEVGPLDAGTYYFRCDVHPTMDGSFEVV